MTPLTRRQAVILALYGRGYNATEIGDRLGMRLDSVSNHLNRIREKLEIEPGQRSKLRRVAIQMRVEELVEQRMAEVAGSDTK